MGARTASRPGALLAVALAVALAGCAARPGVFEQEEREQLASATATEYLDEATGATVSIVGKPLVFARDRSERAANLRDYLTLSAATVNRNGKRTYVLVAYAWSTLDPRFSPMTAAGELVVRADDRRIVLGAGGRTPLQLGIGRPVHPPVGFDVPTLVYPADLPLLRFLSMANQLSVQVGAAGERYDYELWEDQRASLAEFVAFLEGLPTRR